MKEKPNLAVLVDLRLRKQINIHYFIPFPRYLRNQPSPGIKSVCYLFRPINTSRTNCAVTNSISL
jgi:hypothetical protein